MTLARRCILFMLQPRGHRALVTARASLAAEEATTIKLVTRGQPDPERDVLAIEVTLAGDAALRPYVLIAPAWQ